MRDLLVACKRTFVLAVVLVLGHHNLDQRAYPILGYARPPGWTAEVQASIRSEEMARLCALLRELRVQAGLRQQDLADRLGEPQSFVSKYEAGERRLDLIELDQVCDALETDLVSLVQRFKQADGGQLDG